MSNDTEGPLSKAMREAFDGIKCWALHIEGPDDILAAPNKQVAEFAAEVTNRWLREAAGDEQPAARAIVVEWAYSHESWRDGCEQFAADWADWAKRQQSGEPA